MLVVGGVARGGTGVHHLGVGLVVVRHATLSLTLRRQTCQRLDLSGSVGIQIYPEHFAQVVRSYVAHPDGVTEQRGVPARVGYARVLDSGDEKLR